MVDILDGLASREVEGTGIGEQVYKDWRFLVTTKLFRTRRQTYQISRIEKTEVRRSFLPFVLPIVIAILYGMHQFHEYLYDNEKLTLLLFAAGSLVFGLFVGTLSVQSKALGEVAAFGSVRRLQRVRRAIDKAIERYDHEMNEQMRGLMVRDGRGSGSV